MKIEVDMADFIAYGGSNKFAANISQALFIDASRVKVTSIRKGSVILTTQSRRAKMIVLSS